MDEMIKQIMGKTGMTMEQVKPVANQVIAFIKERLPGPLGSQLDKLLGDNKAADPAGAVLDQLGTLFGK